MDTSLQQAREAELHADKITRSFAANPEGPLDGSIHPAFRYPFALPSTSLVEDRVVDMVASSTSVKPKPSSGLVEEQEDRFRRAMKDYEDSAKPKYRTGVDVDNVHSVEQLWLIVDNTIEEYSLGSEQSGWTRIRAGLRKLGDGSEAIQGWLGPLPTESAYLSVVCGGLKLILKAAARLRNVADKVLTELAGIPAILSTVQRVLKIYPDSRKLVELSDEIYQAVLIALGQMLEYLKRKAGRKVAAAIFKQQCFESDLVKKIENIAAARDNFNTEAELCHKEAQQKLQDITAKGGEQVMEVLSYLSHVIATGQKEQKRSDQKIQEYFDLMNHTFIEVMQFKNIVMERLFETLKCNPKVNDAAYQELKRLPQNDWPAGYHMQRRLSLFERIQKPRVRPSQARKNLLDRLDYDRDSAGQDVMTNYQFDPTLTRDEQERCLYAMKSMSLTQWALLERSSVLVINGNSSGTIKRKSGLSFLCARLVYSLDNIRFGDESDLGSLVRPEIVPIHFFCGQHPHNDSSERWESPSGVVNSLLVQLVSQCKTIDLSRLPTLQDSDLDSSNVADVLKLFGLVIRQLPPNFIVFCIVDAVSFYTNSNRVSKSAECLVAGLLKLARTNKKESKNCATFKLLLTATSRLRTEEVDALDDKQVLNSPKTLPDTGGLTAMKWDRVPGNQLKNI